MICLCFLNEDISALDAHYEVIIGVRQMTHNIIAFSIMYSGPCLLQNLKSQETSPLTCLRTAFCGQPMMKKDISY